MNARERAGETIENPYMRHTRRCAWSGIGKVLRTVAAEAVEAGDHQKPCASCGVGLTVLRAWDKCGQTLKCEACARAQRGAA